MKTHRSLACFVFLCTIFSAPIFAGGDKAGEPPQVTPDWVKKLPPAPPLPVGEALKTFKLQPGFRLEVVAADPLISDPIALAFDPDGRIYVVEYRGYMPHANCDVKEEQIPVGVIALLEDSDGDGVMDKRTDFLDKLVMPRAINVSNGGVIVAEPPKLLFARDRDGDGKADTRGSLPHSYGTQGNPEHTANGLIQGLDNWIYSSNYDGRLRWKDSHTLMRDSITPKGQWGISQDDYGRLYFNTNSNLLFADLIPSHYLFRNVYYIAPAKEMGVGVEIVKDQTVYSARVNPGVNRGYQGVPMKLSPPGAPTTGGGTLRSDGHLSKVTATCAPGVYRGDNFPPEYKGNVFIPEPSANLIKRELITENGIRMSGASAYNKDEFLTSTDERFRPVNIYTGPDGCLYIVDLYRGILQHRNFLTTYLKDQSLARTLDKHNGMGRIYRVVHEGKKPGPKPQLSKQTSAELVAHLSHPNGWWRETAQRLLFERKDDSVAPELRRIASSPEPATSLGRLHALWTLEGLGAVDLSTIKAALTDPRPKIQAHAIRVSEVLMRAPLAAPGETPKPFTPPQELLDTLKEMAAKNTDETVRVQLVLSLSDVPHPTAEDVVDSILKEHIDDPIIRGAAITGLGGREVEFLKRVLAQPEWAKPSKPDKTAAGRQTFISALAGCVMKRRVGERIEMMFALAAEQTGDKQWRAAEIVKGMVANGPKNNRRAKLPGESAALNKLMASADPVIGAEAKKLDALVKWPNRPGLEPEPPPLAGDHLASFERGREVYKLCADCHHSQGWGVEGKAPPLADSEWALGTEQRTVRMILHGMSGPKKIGDIIYNKSGNLEMPAMAGTLNDQQIADVLTYIRREWDNFAPQVNSETVSQIRAKEKGREGPWIEKELNDLAGKAEPAPKEKKK